MNTTGVAILAVSSGGGSMNMHSVSSIGWQSRIEEDRATHFVVIFSDLRTRLWLRGAFENLGRSPSAEKHVHEEPAIL